MSTPNHHLELRAPLTFHSSTINVSVVFSVSPQSHIFCCSKLSRLEQCLIAACVQALKASLLGESGNVRVFGSILSIELTGVNLVSTKMRVIVIVVAPFIVAQPGPRLSSFSRTCSELINGPL